MKLRLLIITFLTGVFSMPAYATIVSGVVTGGTSLGQGGTFVNLTVPFTESNPDNTVGDDTFQTPHLYGFDEGQNILVTADINVDILADGMGGGIGAGIISAGDTVASHYIFFDPDNLISQEGSVTFDSDIVAIITSSGNLAGSDFLINTGVTYLNPGLRGLEGGDSATISGLRSIFVDWTAGTPGDYVRVLTDFSPGAVVPIPAAAWLFGTFLFGLFGVTRFKREN